VLSKQILVNPLCRRFRFWEKCAQFLNTPNVVVDSGLHGWRDSQCAVNSAEIVMQGIKRTMWPWFSIFLLNPFVRRVKRRIDMRIVRF
jgi:hypothetical protein